MPYRKISKDIKIAAMRLYQDDILSKPALLDYLRISSRTFDRILALWNATGVDWPGFGSVQVRGSSA